MQPCLKSLSTERFIWMTWELERRRGSSWGAMRTRMRRGGSGGRSLFVRFCRDPLIACITIIILLNPSARDVLCRCVPTRQGRERSKKSPSLPRSPHLDPSPQSTPSHAPAHARPSIYPISAPQRGPRLARPVCSGRLLAIEWRHLDPVRP